MNYSASSVGLHSFADGEPQARALAILLGLPYRPIALRRFPDGESLVRIAAGDRRVIIYRSLDNPNAKLVELVLAAGALRDAGVAHLTLVCPYLAYMRQDMAFHAGEAVSQRIVGRLLGGTFDRVLTVDPHLHRTHHLSEAVPATEALAVGAAPVLAEFLRAAGCGPDTTVVGPDAESRQWAAAVATPLGLPLAVAEKQRRGDHEVSVALPPDAALGGRHVVLVDDVVSSGHTLIEAARAATAAGAASVEALVVHALYDDETARRLAAAGIARVRSCDSVPHPSNAVALAPLLAAALRERLAA